MPTQTRKTKAATAVIVEPPVEEKKTETAAEKRKRLDGEMKEMLDEIDEVLETNAEEFVRNYVQKGGE